MPLYEYKCQRCNNNFELFKPMSESSKEQMCPHCGKIGKKGRGKRVYSTPAFHNKELPKGHNLSATKRRELWDSPDPKDFKQLM